MQDGANAPVIEPRVLMEFPQDPAGLGSSMSLRFAGDSLYAVDSVWNHPPTRIVWWYATPVASVLLPFAAALAVWLLWRLLSRPRRRGWIYCRGCNHELSAPNAAIGEGGLAVWMSENARCPECGRRAKPPMVAGPRWWRIMPPLAAMVLLIGCVACVVATLEWFVATRPIDPKTWPVEGLEKYLGSWAVMRRDDGRAHTGMSRITRIPLSGGVAREVARDRIAMLQGVLASPNERYVVLSSLDKRASIRIVEPATGRSRLVPLNASQYSHPTAVGFSADSRFVYVSVAEQFVSRPDQLCRVDLQSGAVEVLAEHMRERPIEGSYQGFSRFVVREHPGGLAWAHVSSPGNQFQNTGLIISWPGPEGMKRLVTRAPHTSMAHFAWHPDLRRLVVADRENVGASYLIELEGRGAVSQYFVYPYQGTERGFWTWSSGPDLTLNNRNSLELAMLRGAGRTNRSLSRLEVSPDGTWAAAFVSAWDVNDPRPASLPPLRPGVRGEIWIWNLCEGNGIQN